MIERHSNNTHLGGIGAPENSQISNVVRVYYDPFYDEIIEFTLLFSLNLIVLSGFNTKAEFQPATTMFEIEDFIELEKSFIYLDTFEVTE